MPESFSIPYVPTLFLWMHNNMNSMCNRMMSVQYRAGPSNMTFRNIEAAAVIFFFFLHKLKLVHTDSSWVDADLSWITPYRLGAACGVQYCVCIYSYSMSVKTSNQSQIFLCDLIIFSSLDTLILVWHSKVWLPSLLNPSVYTQNSITTHQ